VLETELAEAKVAAASHSEAQAEAIGRKAKADLEEMIHTGETVREAVASSHR
jgi:hypothetical protein